MFLEGMVNVEEATKSMKDVLDKINKEKFTIAEQKASALGVSLEIAMTHSTDEILNLKFQGEL